MIKFTRFPWIARQRLGVQHELAAWGAEAANPRSVFISGQKRWPMSKSPAPIAPRNSPPTIRKKVLVDNPARLYGF